MKIPAEYSIEPPGVGNSYYTVMWNGMELTRERSMGKAERWLDSYLEDLKRTERESANTPEWELARSMFACPICGASQGDWCDDEDASGPCFSRVDLLRDLKEYING